MDSPSFDRWTRLFAAARSRRTVGGAALGSVAALIGLTGAEAARCGRGKKRCGNRCIPQKRCCTNADCQPKRTGLVCRKGRCQCPAGQKACPGRCIPTAQTCDATCPPPAQTCSTPADCPEPPACQLCAVRTCDNGQCGIGAAPEGQPCRPARGDCDVTEVCDGSSLECPPDEFQPASYACFIGHCEPRLDGTYVARPTVYCTGDGPTCPPLPMPERNCGFYGCMQDGFSVSCLTTCQTDDDCIATAHCEEPACVPN